MRGPLMRVALVSPYSWDVPGGVNRHVEQLARYLRGRGHLVTVIAPGGESGEGFLSAGRSFPVRANRSVANIAFDPGTATRVRRILRDNAFDVIHAHEPLVPSVSLLALIFSRSANVGTFHAAREGGSLGYRLAGPVLRPLARRLHVKAAVSPAAWELVGRYFPGEYRLLPNGVDLRVFNPWGPDLEGVRGEWSGDPASAGGARENGIEALRGRRKMDLIFVGREEPRKGLHVLLEALPEIRRGFPGTRLLVVGSEDTGRRMEGVVWLGRLPDEMLPAAYRSAALLVAPALGWESFGIVLLEAMACGLPVVASDIPGYGWVVENGVQGLLVPPGDAPRLARAVMDLLGDAEKRSEMSAAALERAREFSWDKLVIEVEEAYEEALRVKKAR